MVGAAFAGADLGEMSRRNNLDQILVVQGKNFAGNPLNSRVDQIESIFSGVDVPDDAVVDIDECVFGHLHTSEQAVEQFHLVHLVTAETNFGLGKSPT